MTKIRRCCEGLVATWIATCVVMFSGIAMARADSLEQLFIMPGPVIAGHADIEGDCKQCHAPLADTPQDDLCVVCHEEVGADIRRQMGYHGRVPEARSQDCAVCHAEHEGRDTQVVNIDLASFSHSLTDFPLLGAHTETDCESCHTEGLPFREADTYCIACHRQDDTHEGSLGPLCGDCHTAVNWVQTRFDHDGTRFPLTGQHEVLSCNACHEQQTYTFDSVDCVACHRNDDVHRGGNGPQCESCHDTVAWSRIDFDHLQVSSFPLTGGHAGLTCQGCHKAADFRDRKGADCYACHRDDDVHQGRNGNDCESCHVVRNWTTVSFDHAKASGFRLNGAHGALGCDTCHVTNVQDALPRDCAGCHAANDPHKNQLGADCAGCHGETSWTVEVRFDHDLTVFPLIGEHGELACAQCHQTPAFHDAAADCQACHAKDDVHSGGLGSACEVCHNPADWGVWRFDHALQTSFSLTGAHADLNCAACHREPATMDGSPAAVAECASCHRLDDPHAGRFGNDCGRCHTTTSFNEIEAL